MCKSICRFAALSAVLTLLLSGCAYKGLPIQPLSANSAALQSGRTLSIVSHPMPAFNTMRSSQVGVSSAFGVIGGIVLAEILAREGAHFAPDNHIVDPGPIIATSSAAALADQYGLKIVHDMPALGDKDTIDALVDSNHFADLLLDVKTTQWGFHYMVGHIATYDVHYRAQLRLIDVHTRSIVAQGSCSYWPGYTPGQPTSDDLMDNQGFEIKRRLRIDTLACIDEFETRVLHLDSQVTARSHAADATIYPLPAYVAMPAVASTERLPAKADRGTVIPDPHRVTAGDVSAMAAAPDQVDFARVTSAGKAVWVSSHGAWDIRSCQGRFIPKITVDQPPSHGSLDIQQGIFSLSVNAGQCAGRTIKGVLVTYVPDPGFRGRDSFHYRSSGQPNTVKTAVVDVQ